MKNLSEKYGNFFTLVCKVGGRFCNRKNFLYLLFKRKRHAVTKLGLFLLTMGHIYMYIPEGIDPE